MDALQGIENAKLLRNWNNITEGTSHPNIWCSLAIGLNYYLNLHTDQDFFYSLVTIASAHGLQEDINKYDIQSKVCNIFTFSRTRHSCCTDTWRHIAFQSSCHLVCLSMQIKMYFVYPYTSRLALWKK